MEMIEIVRFNRKMTGKIWQICVIIANGSGIHESLQLFRCPYIAIITSLHTKLSVLSAKNPPPGGFFASRNCALA
jgi:hypothetical protein